MTLIDITCKSCGTKFSYDPDLWNGDCPVCLEKAQEEKESKESDYVEQNDDLDEALAEVEAKK